MEFNLKGDWNLNIAPMSSLGCLLVLILVLSALFGVSPWSNEHARIGTWLWIGAIASLVALRVSLAFTFRYSQGRRDRFARRVVASDRPPAFSLYLRSFQARDREAEDSEDEVGAIRAVYDRLLEVSLVKAFGKSAPLIGLRRKEESHSPRSFVAESHGGLSGGYIGAGRVSVSSSSWQDVVERCLTEADTILVIPDHGEGLLWEVEMIVSKGYLEKTVFVMPPYFYREGDEDTERGWDDIARRYEAIGLKIPLYSRSGGLFAFRGEDGECISKPIPWIFKPEIDENLLKRDLEFLR